MKITPMKHSRELAEFEAQPNGHDARQFTARPYVWRDPCTIPPRQWLHAGHYIRKFASATIAPGGLGKSSLQLVEAIGIVLGRNLLGGQVASKPLIVWYWNLEDPMEEIERRIAAILLYYRIAPEEIDGRLFVNSGREDKLVIAQKTRDATLICYPVVKTLNSEIIRLHVDAVIVDPFVACHQVPENDNNAIAEVARTWANIAEETNCAVELAHHVRKPSSGSSAEFGVDDARGAGSLIGATRSNRVLNRMSKDEAENAGVPLEHRRSYFRVDKGEKDNMRPSVEYAEWRKFESVPLDNDTIEDPGDLVGVVTHWVMPKAQDPLDGLQASDLLKVQKRIAESMWRENSQANLWAGKAVAEVLGLDIGKKSDLKRVKAMLAKWIASGALKVVLHDDEKRRERLFIEVGELAV